MATLKSCRAQVRNYIPTPFLRLNRLQPYFERLGGDETRGSARSDNSKLE